jgi:hypothetical protein
MLSLYYKLSTALILIFKFLEGKYFFQTFQIFFLICCKILKICNSLEYLINKNIKRQKGGRNEKRKFSYCVKRINID